MGARIALRSSEQPIAFLVLGQLWSCRALR